jgi:hypothetical protein
MPECRRAPSLPRRLPKEVPKVIQTLLAPSVRVPRKGSGLTGPCWTWGIFSDCFDTFYGFVDQDLRLKCHPFPFPRSVTNAIVSLPGPCWHEATKPFHHLFSVPHEFFSHTRHFSISPILQDLHTLGPRNFRYGYLQHALPLVLHHVLNGLLRLSATSKLSRATLLLPQQQLFLSPQARDHTPSRALKIRPTISHALPSKPTSQSCQSTGGITHALTSR